MTKKRAYCKNTVQGSQRGRKYPPKLRAEVVMAMVASNNICAVARRYKVPESTIRSWLAEEAAKGDAFAEARQAAALTPTDKAADETEAAPPMICIGAEGTGDEAEVEVE